ncbi:putative zinc-ribbon domain, plant protein [Rosa chinensis]|uniref:Putative zinc-ribbon domain, plant protein n=1 Tax=Rosa chinensis TaxID=74649 RepID=A0A2P6P6A8_ROSCH|nr:uncharacterized protein LOC112176404 isoform X1 [Rosa chinensis]PRQ17475.1 putative zinc-ribbon domain, plant protein [Rosa chinensis]
MDLRRGRGKERVFGERKVDSSSSSTSSLRRENKEVFDDNHINVREGVRGLRLEESGAPQKKEFVERYSRLSEFPIDNRIPGNDLDTNMNRSESVNSSVGDISAQLRYLAGSLRSRESMDQWGVERDRYEGFYGNIRVAAERGRMPISSYPNEGPSNYHLESSYGHGEHKYDVNGVENLGPDRVELLRKMDELKEQLRRSYDVADKPRDMVPPERSRTPPDPYGDRLTYSLSLQQQYVVDKQMPRSPYLNYSHGPVPFMDHHNMHTQNFYPQRNNLNVIPEYEDPSQPQMTRRPSHHPLQYPQPQPHDYFRGQHMGFNQNPLASYPHELVVHLPACTCSGCYNQNCVVPPQVPHTDFGNRSIPKGPVNLNSYHHVNPVTYTPHNYPRNASPTRWQGDVDSDIDGYGERYLGKMINRRAQISHPFRGGAPFITCFHCFELLKLPRKFKKRSKNQSELRCGSCLTIISVELNNKRLITSASAPKESKQSSSEVDKNSKEVLRGNVLSSPDCLNADDTNSCHDDLDNSGQNLQLIVAEDNSLAEDEWLNLDISEKREGHSSSPSISSKEEEDTPDSMIIQRDVSDSVEQLAKDACSPIAPGSPLWEQPDSPSKHEVSEQLDSPSKHEVSEQLDSPSKHDVSRDGNGNKSACIDQDKVLFSRSTSAQKSVKDMSVETEVDDSYNDYLNTNISQDSTEASKEDRPKIRKGTDNFLVGLIKKSFKDSSKSDQIVERTKVLINGQPIPDHLVRKAEKLAGPIQPGDYWYDFRAGFWGVMGHSCLGIIPPSIEEFSYPMPTNCGAGNTGVYVNGRELHERDLDLLASRGLPTTRERFYILEISGRVVDEDSGEELKSLGRLAPTIEKVGHGFGMKVPRMAV